MNHHIVTTKVAGEWLAGKGVKVSDARNSNNVEQSNHEESVAFEKTNLKSEFLEFLASFSPFLANISVTEVTDAEVANCDGIPPTSLATNGWHNE